LPPNEQTSAGAGAGPPSIGSLARRLRWNSVVVVWLVLALTTVLLARENAAAPGLYYDEAVFAGTARDFLAPETHGRHMPGCQTIELSGRPFPLFVVRYLGALKCWMLLPAFAAFGTDLGVLRFATLGWALLALLILMLWARSWLGAGPAVLVGCTLALDPAWFFLSILDWGVAVPSFLCRFASFFLVLLWWQKRRLVFAFFAAFFAGLGFFNKVDFAVIVLGAGAAAVSCNARPFWERLRARPVLPVVMLLGFTLGAGPMTMNVLRVLEISASRGGKWDEKLNTALAMYDGSYFHRLMDVGGIFVDMFQTPSPVWSPFGAVLVIALAVLCGVATCRTAPEAARRGAGFLLLAATLVTCCVFLLPGAARIHHAVLVYPFPHLAITAATTFAWTRFSSPSFGHRAVRLLLASGVILFLAYQLLAIRQTQHLIRETGGRGWWSESLDAFCAQIKNRSDLTVVSLDWGFNEQLIFLTNGPQLAEPVWSFRTGSVPPLPTTRDVIYLLHPPEYSLFKHNNVYLDAARSAGEKCEIQPYCDRQNRVAFYTLRFKAH
jgi:hypothetical protein